MPRKNHSSPPADSPSPYPNSSKVADIHMHGTQEIVDALRELLSRAEKGHIRGLAFAIKTGPNRHRIGFTGQYWQNPVEAIGVAAQMQYRANGVLNSRDDMMNLDGDQG